MEITTEVLNKISAQPRCGLIKFDYDTTRKKYFSYFHEFLTEINRHDPWSREKQKEMIEILISTVKSVKVNEMKQKLTDYEVVEINQTNTLVLSKSTTEVLTFEDCFDVFVDAHIHATEHGNYQEMLDLLDSNYIFHTKCLCFFLKCCNVCGAKIEETVEDKYYRNNDKFTAQLDILDLKNIVFTSSYRYLLVYIDNNSEYVILRVLNNLSVSNMGAELMKIFTDFGPPSEVQVITPMVPSFNSALEYVKSVMNFKCETGSKSDPNPKSLRAFVLLKEMISTENATNIMTKCFFVQKTLNSLMENGQCPTQKLFGKYILRDIINIPKLNASSEISTNYHIVTDLQTEDNPRSIICHICNEDIFNFKNECFLCKKVVHLVCGVRVPLKEGDDEIPIQHGDIYCINCHRFQTKCRREKDCAVT
ncbi:unnamed protein product [Colias eurytheme]|nr:unnamed protein product [Colias eurytheme]